MSEVWTTATVESVCTRVTTGGTPSRRRPDFFENGTIPWFKTGELRDRLLADSEEYITTEALESSSAKIFPIHTVLMAMYGDGDTITNLGIMLRPAATNQACCAMIVDPLVCDWRYLFFALKYTRTALLRIVVGGAQRNLSGTIIRQHQIPLPPLREQQGIACILGALDDKIELNRQMNRVLEAMARAIFKAWFVDFEPVRAKAAGAAGFPGMPQPVFDSLPTRLVDSELGEIPEGWSIGQLSDYCGVNEETAKLGDLPPEIEYINISSVTVGRLDQMERMRAGEAPSRARRRVKHGDTIWSCVRPNRRSYLFIHNPSSNCIVSTGFAVLSPSEFGASYLYQLVTRGEFVDYLVANATGSAYPAVLPDHFNRAPVIEPTPLIREAFESVTMPLIDLVANNERESRILASLRDTLLPKLISGEIRVPVKA